MRGGTVLRHVSGSPSAALISRAARAHAPRLRTPRPPMPGFTFAWFHLAIACGAGTARRRRRVRRRVRRMRACRAAVRMRMMMSTARHACTSGARARALRVRWHARLRRRLQGCCACTVRWCACTRVPRKRMPATSWPVGPCTCTQDDRAPRGREPRAQLPAAARRGGGVGGQRKGARQCRAGVAGGGGRGHSKGVRHAGVVLPFAGAGAGLVKVCNGLKRQ